MCGPRPRMGWLLGFFDLLLQKANVSPPRRGFGPSGEGYIRLTAFGGAEATAEAVKRIKGVL